MTQREREEQMRAFLYDLQHLEHPPMAPDDVRVTGILPAKSQIHFPVNPEFLAQPRAKEIA